MSISIKEAYGLIDVLKGVINGTDNPDDALQAFDCIMKIRNKTEAGYYEED